MTFKYFCEEFTVFKKMHVSWGASTYHSPRQRRQEAKTTESLCLFWSILEIRKSKCQSKHYQWRTSRQLGPVHTAPFPHKTPQKRRFSKPCQKWIFTKIGGFWKSTRSLWMHKSGGFWKHSNIQQRVPQKRSNVNPQKQIFLLRFCYQEDQCRPTKTDVQKRTKTEQSEQVALMQKASMQKSGYQQKRSSINRLQAVSALLSN